MTNLISPQEAAKWLASGDAILIDVRESNEFSEEHIAYATSLPLSAVHDLVEQLQIPASRKIIVQCLKGGRGAQACALIQEKEFYKNELYNLEGGITAWKEANLPIVKNITESTKTAPTNQGIFSQVNLIIGGFISLFVLLGFLEITAGFILAGILGVALFFAGLSGKCGLAILLSKMPWNK